jgi:hypothetical protein
MRLGVGDALIEQPHVQLFHAFDANAWGEEAFAHEANLVLGLSLLPA